MNKIINSNVDIKEIFRDAKNDPECVSTIDIDELLNAVNGKNLEYLDNKTIKSINKEIFDALQSIGCDEDQLEKYCKYLIGYRLVNEIYELHKGKCVKTIRIFDSHTPNEKPNIILKNFGLVTGVKFTNTNTHVHCVLFKPTRFFKYTFDYFLTFQKLSYEEQLILMAYDHIEKIEKNEHNELVEVNTNIRTFESIQHESKMKTLEKENRFERMKLENEVEHEIEMEKNIEKDIQDNIKKINYDPTLHDMNEYNTSKYATSYANISYDPTQNDYVDNDITSYDPTKYDPTSDYEFFSYDPTLDDITQDDS